jgi:Skp family chaperone for outer membrane proteins
MSEYDASVILEKNSVVWSLASIDITSVIVERVDKAFMKTSGAQKPELED